MPGGPPRIRDSFHKQRRVWEWAASIGLADDRVVAAARTPGMVG